MALLVDARISVSEDTGCEFSPSCLRCPLPQCKYDLMDRGRWERTAWRDAKMLELYRRGMATREIARRYGLSLRATQAAVQRAQRRELAR